MDGMGHAPLQVTARMVVEEPAEMMLASKVARVVGGVGVVLWEVSEVGRMLKIWMVVYDEVDEDERVLEEMVAVVVVEVEVWARA